MGDPVIKVGRVLDLVDESEVDLHHTDVTEGLGVTAGRGVEVFVRDEQGDSAFHIDEGDPRSGMWKEYLRSRRETGTPVYVEADGATNEVLSILPSYLYTVEAVRPAADGSGLSVCFLQSPAVSLLRSSHSHYDALRQVLADAAEDKGTVLVTCQPDSREIIDARRTAQTLSPPEVSNGPLPAAGPPLLDIVPGLLPAPLSSALFETHLTLSQALAAFDFVASIPELEIPFKYPVDCCMARAHLMCRLLRDYLAISARKIWNYGSGFSNNQATLRFDTANHPKGSVPWRYHVAPVVSVPDFHARFLVLDPSMFIVRPVTVETWLGAQNDPGATQSDSSAAAFSHRPTGEETLDDLLNSTNDQLGGHRLAWQSLRMSFFVSPPLPL